MFKKSIVVLSVMLASLSFSAFASPIPQGAALVKMHDGWRGLKNEGFFIVHTPSFAVTPLLIKGTPGLPAPFGGGLTQGTISPDGKRVAILARESALDIWIVDNDGKNPRRAAQSLPGYFNNDLFGRHSARHGIDWASDGYLYWGQANKIYRLNPDGGTPELVLTTPIPEVFHLSASHDGQWFGCYQVTDHEYGHLIRRSDGATWRFQNNYNGVSGDGSVVLEATFVVEAGWPWGSKFVLHSIPLVAQTQTIISQEERALSRVDTLTAYGSTFGETDAMGPGGAHRVNQMRFSVNSDDYIVSTGENGSNSGRVLLTKRSTDESWNIEILDTAYTNNVISDWWQGELPQPDGTVGARALPTTSSALAAHAQPVRLESGSVFHYSGNAQKLRIVDPAGRTAATIALDPTRSKHQITWTGSRGSYLVVPVR